MEIQITNHRKLLNIPSGSGIVKSHTHYYIIGDDSPLLFKLNEEFETVSTIQLINSDHVVGNRIIKAEKPDFESLELIGDDELVAFGSGSKSPQRNVFLHILLKDPLKIEQYDLTEFYDGLRNLKIMQNSELNIEGVAFNDHYLFLFNRKKNIIFKFNFSAFINYVKKKAPFPKFEIQEFTLPKINGIEAGFSGATVLRKNSKIIFTASVEDTTNAYDDGEILGSFIGMIDIDSNAIPTNFEYCAIPNINEVFKVESVTVVKEVSKGKTNLVLITDDDLGNSILLESTIKW